MKLSEVLDFLNQVEEKFAVETWVINGVHLWPIIRIDLKLALEYSDLGVSNSIGLSKRLKGLLSGILKKSVVKIMDYKMNQFNRKKYDVLILGDGSSFQKLNDVFYDKFCDPFIEEFKKFNKQTYKLEPTHSYIYPRVNPSVFIQSKLDFLNIFSKYFKAKRQYVESLEGYEAYQDFFRERISHTEPHNLEQLRLRADKINLLTKFFKDKFRKTGVKLGMLVCYYSDYGMAFNKAAYELQIPTVDIQHGVQGDFHAAYGRWLRVPQLGYPLLPKYFWCWGKVEEESINNWSYKLSTHKPINGGNLFFNIWKDDDRDYVKFYKKKVLEISKNNGKNILLSLSFGLDTQEILSEVLQVIKAKQNEFNWWIRLHPSMLDQKQNIINLLNANDINNFEIDNASALPLYALLTAVDIHITHSSTVVIEAANLKIPSVVFSDYGITLYKQELLDGLAVKAVSADEIVHSILRISSQQKDAVNLNTVSNEKNAIQYLTKLIDKTFV